MDYDSTAGYVSGLVEKDPWMMGVLRAAASLGLPDWWIGAGFVRNKVWDTLHNYQRPTARPGMDVDVVYFDKEKTDPREDRELELLLYSLKPGVPWSVKNQARMHEQNEDPPYKSSADAISQWPETATCVGIKLRGNRRLELIAPQGLDDITGLRVRPNPDCKHNPQAFILRLHKKDWLEKWPKLSIFYE